MKVISKKNLMILLPLIKQKDFDIDDFEVMLDRFGDDYFIEDGVLTKTKENAEMVEIRKTVKRNVKNGGKK